VQLSILTFRAVDESGFAERTLLIADASARTKLVGRMTTARSTLALFTRWLTGLFTAASHHFYEISVEVLS
jgi:hypothetical protein